MTSRLFWWNEINDLRTRIKMHIFKAKLPFYPPCEVKCRLQNEVSIVVRYKSNKGFSLSLSLKIKKSNKGKKIRTKFSNKINCSLRLQPYSITFYWRWILTNSTLDYIFFLYLHTCKISRKLKINNYVINKFFKLQVFVI